MNCLKKFLNVLSISSLSFIACDKDEKTITPPTGSWTPKLNPNMYWEYETKEGETVSSTSRLESSVHPENSDVIVIKSTESSQTNESHYIIRSDGLYRIAHKGSPVKGNLRSQKLTEDTLVTENVHTLLYPIELGKSWTVQTTNNLTVTREYLLDTTIVLNKETYKCVKIKRTEIFGGNNHIEYEYLSPIGLVMIKKKLILMTQEGNNANNTMELITSLIDYGGTNLTTRKH